MSALVRNPLLRRNIPESCGTDFVFVNTQATMKKNLVKLTSLLALLQSAAAPVMADYASTVTGLGPVANWRLNESVTVPNGNSAINLGSLGAAAIGYYTGAAVHPSPGALAGRTDSAASYDGSADASTFVPYLPSLNPAAPFSAEVWLQPGAEKTGADLTCAISSGQFADPRTGWLIYQSATGWNLRMYNNNGTATSLNISGGTAPVVGTWYHLAFTYDGTDTLFYINGVKAAEGKPTSYVPGASGGFRIGGRADSSFWWIGSADEAAVYPKALSATVIAARYANGTAANPSSSYESLVLADAPLAYYRLNEGAYTAPVALPVAANSGSAGASINGSYNPGMLSGAAGPRPPSLSGFTAANTAGEFNGSAGFVGTPYSMNGMTAFTMLGWIKRGAIKSGRGGYFGQNDLLEFGDADAGANFELWVNARGGNIKGPFPFADDEWGFIAVTGDATSTVVYANGKEVGRMTGPLESYGESTYLFNIGGGGIFGAAGDNFRGTIDEVAVFDKALTAAQVLSTYHSANIAPRLSSQPSLPSRSLYAGYTLSLTANAAGTPPLAYQWRRNGTAIAGQTAATLNIAGVALTDSGSYDVVVSNPYGSATSTGVAVTVLAPDGIAPALKYAAGLADLTTARIWLSKPLDPVSAQNIANYTIPGLTITSAKLFSPAGTANDDSVLLTTSAQTPGQTYTITLSGVKDQMSPASTIAAASTITFGSWALSSGTLRFEHYDNIPGAADSALTGGLSDPRVLAGTPTTLGAISGKFDTRTVFPDDSHENYLAKISGYITPKETGDYYFFLASDDASRVFLSATERMPDPFTDSPIVFETGCCNGFYEPDSGDTATTATPISLQAGKNYAILAYLKEGGGGDWLRLAWRKSTDSTAAASLTPIDGQFLSSYSDPNAELAFTQLPENPSRVLPSTSINFASLDFSSTDAGFSVTNTTPEPPGPWVYNPGAGGWVADGAVSGCGGPYNSRLQSTPFVVPQDQTVTLKFTHRYSFEGDLYDGGQVRISVNGGDFTNVPPANFTANGYANGLIIGNGILKDQRAFNADSPGYSQETFITSVAILGALKKNDTVVVEFLGGWDDCSTAQTPSWIVKNMSLSYSSAPQQVVLEAAGTAARQGVKVPFTYQWQRNDGQGFVNLPNENAASYRFFPTVQADLTAVFRVGISVAGRTLYSDAAVNISAGNPPAAFGATALTGVVIDAATKTLTANLPTAGSQGFFSIQPKVTITGISIVGGKLVIRYQ